MATFGDIWRGVRLHAANAPFGLCRTWTQEAYETLFERRPWVFSVKETRLVIGASRTLAAVNVTQASPLITSAGLFALTDAGRQFRVGTFPVYTIASVQDVNNATLDLAYADITGSPAATILDLYQTLPADFGAFLLVLDTTVRRQVAWWFTQEDLARVDPTRVVSGTPQRALVSTTPSPALTTLGQPRFEWWPAPLTARIFPAWYRARPQQLLDTDVLPGVLAQRGKILETGALARCARWPGTVDVKNPYFNLALAQQLMQDFDRECAKLELRDDDQAQQTWVGLPYHGWPAFGLTGDTTTLRASDATVADYY